MAVKQEGREGVKSYTKEETTNFSDSADGIGERVLLRMKATCEAWVAGQQYKIGVYIGKHLRLME
jgi:hypothetical protein